MNSALFSDLDVDGFPELLLACAWGPPRIYKNDAGSFREITEESGLGALTGLWQGIATGDFDGDGQLDFVASNWGLNSPWHATPAQPLLWFYGDFAGLGRHDVIEAYVTDNRTVPRFGLEILGPSLPFLTPHFPTHQTFARASLEDILRTSPVPAKTATAITLASTLFLNRGGRFVPIPLPIEAQFSPSSGVAAADFNGDGLEDLFLAQNFFRTRPELPRLDAGRGLLLLGKGNGEFHVLPARESGVEIYGEQSAVAHSDYDQDGRPDLIITQPDGATTLLRNRTGRPGLRVRLKGPPGNPQAIGAVVRLLTAGRPTPAREIQAGTGYHSQNSLVPVLPLTGATERVWMRWPGGRISTVPLHPHTSEVIVAY